MLTDDQFADQLGTQLRHELAAIQPRADVLAGVRRRQARRSLVLRVSAAAVPATAAAAAVAVVAASSSGGGMPAPSTVLTVAMVQRVASASRLALAQSGQAKITYRETDNGALQVTGTDSIAFAGKNWSDASSQTFPAAGRGPGHTQFSVNRIVNGQVYLYIKGRNGRLGWYRDTNPSAHPRVRIPDPRTLFGVLDPSARFEVIGHRVISGMRLTGLRATNLPQLPGLGWLPGVTGARLTQVTVWVDGRDVVHQLALQARQASTTDPIYLKKSADGTLEFQVPSKAYLGEARAMARKVRGHEHATVGIDPSLPATVHHDVGVTSVSVTFTGIGVPQVITVPPHAISFFGQG